MRRICGGWMAARMNLRHCFTSSRRRSAPARRAKILPSEFLKARCLSTSKNPWKIRNLGKQGMNETNGKKKANRQPKGLICWSRWRRCKWRQRIRFRMIIRSLRIKNIKSYGEGAEANGITVNFQRGVNRVAGRKGHGKSTLIEALGYALCSSEPDHGEKFYLPAYFLRAGENQGEIDLVFEHGGQEYRVVRVVGQSKRRSKVLDLSDDSTGSLDDA